MIGKRTLGRTQILDMLEHGEIPFAEAVRMIEARARGEPHELHWNVVRKVKWCRGPNNQRIELTIW